MKINSKLRLDIVCAVLVLAFCLDGITVQSQETNPVLVRTVNSPVPTPSPTPTPLVSPSPGPAPKQVQSLADLQSMIRQRMFATEVRRGRLGVKIVSLASGKVIFENDSEKYFMPASNMKNFTVAAALERLGPDFRFVTSVYANALPDAAGNIQGDLRIFGRGDISISTAFFGTSPTDPETYFKGIDRLVDRIIAAGVKRIEGSIVGDESYFRGFPIPETWEWGDLQKYFAAEISALPLNDNAVDVTVTPGAAGRTCIVSISPPNTLFQIFNTCGTTGASSKRDLTVNKRIGRNQLEISGTMPLGDAGFSGSITVTHPAELSIAVLTQRLEKKGVKIDGGSRLLALNYPSNPSQIEIAKLESPPFSVIAQKTMKPSQNMYTETILWTLGESLRHQISEGEGVPKDDDPQGPHRKRLLKLDSWELGLASVRNVLGNMGIADDGILQYDGSGVSRRNLITPSAVVTLYTYMAKKSKYGQVWSDSLTIGGVDGTLLRRFTGTAAAGNIRGKTGSLDQVSALSGYLTTAGGEQLVVSLIVNGVAETRTRTSLIDDIVLKLADFNGKIE